MITVQKTFRDKNQEEKKGRFKVITFFSDHYFLGRKIKKTRQIQGDDAIFLSILTYVASFVTA